MIRPAEGMSIGQGWVDATTLEAMIADYLAWGERPDAFTAVIKVGAVGWKADDERA